MAQKVKVTKRSSTKRNAVVTNKVTKVRSPLPISTIASHATTHQRLQNTKKVIKTRTLPNTPSPIFASLVAQAKKKPKAS
ncbi:MAG: hypothetical protein Q9183_002405, partial [Haloplaca sp. 2 TL-2023]